MQITSGVRRSIVSARPATANQLHAWVRAVLGFDMPRRPIVDGHAAPFDYLLHTYFEDRSPRDCVVWANRGGGKTQIGAIATLLDLIFKPGIQVRILGGSFEQSSKMHGYLTRMLEDDALRGLVAGNITGKAVTLVNGSRVEVLSQSERAVRGQRVHKLRCDEVEHFTPEVWDAAQLVTRSGQCGETFVTGAIEALSTMHRPFGLMQRLVREAATAQRKIFRWSVIDTLARCEPERPCEPCPLLSACGGRAKRARGFIAIDDAVQQSRRVGSGVWDAEMLCNRPDRSDSVYAEFDPKVHVRRIDEATFRGPGAWIGGMDFGYRAPTVLLWAHLLPDEAGDEILHIVDELVEAGRTTEEHIAMVRARPWPVFEWIGADPAGHQHSEQTGVSVISLWKKAGFRLRTRTLRIERGIDLVRRRLRRADGKPTLLIDPRCERLIESLETYHYPPEKPEATVPVKDGESDHAVDALRYLIVNLDRDDWRVTVRKY